MPAVSPDGQWVAFWAGGVIKKVPFGGGPAVDLARGIRFLPDGLVWDAHGGLLFGNEDDYRIWAIPQGPVLDGVVQALYSCAWARAAP